MISDLGLQNKLEQENLKEGFVPIFIEISNQNDFITDYTNNVVNLILNIFFISKKAN